MPTSPPSIVDLPGIKKLRSGKVREVFDLNDTLLFVVTDRIWAFDVILPDLIPHKGAVLNQISAFWFKRFDMIPNHLITADFEKFPKELQSFREQLAERSMIVEKRSRSRWNVWCAGIVLGRIGKNIRNRRAFAESKFRRGSSWRRNYPSQFLRRQQKRRRVMMRIST
jgi:phosphoribosylaminoimidazole-succinocarboxamide synthase